MAINKLQTANLYLLTIKQSGPIRYFVSFICFVQEENVRLWTLEYIIFKSIHRFILQLYYFNVYSYCKITFSHPYSRMYLARSARCLYVDLKIVALVFWDFSIKLLLRRHYSNELKCKSKELTHWLTCQN